MFKKILNTIIEEEIYTENYNLSDFTIGFELEAWFNPSSWDRYDLEKFFRNIWEDHSLTFGHTIDMNMIDMGEDGTIRPHGQWAEYDSCPECGGEGTESCYACDGDGSVRCDECFGNGHIRCNECDGDGTNSIECHKCEGSGKNIKDEEEDCPVCEGEGNLDVECDECDSDGDIRCDECDGDGRVECFDCYGSGYHTCDNCGGEEGGESTISYEWGSPILNFTPANLQKMILFLQKGIKEEAIYTNETCGFHIHIGFPDPNKRAEDIFWILCNLVTKNKSNMLNEILEFKGYDLHSDRSSSYAATRHIRALQEEFENLYEEIKEKKQIYKAKGKEEKDDLGHYDVDIEDEKYKGFQEDVFFETKKYKEGMQEELELWKELFYKYITRFYDDRKYTILRQHSKHGTLEWRGARHFMDNGDVQDVKDFLINKLYPFVNWIRNTLSENYLYLKNDIKLSRKAFDELLSLKTPPISKPKTNKHDKRFNRLQKREDLNTIFKNFPEINKFKLKGALIEDFSKDKIKISEGFIDLTYYQILLNNNPKARFVNRDDAEAYIENNKDKLDGTVEIKKIIVEPFDKIKEIEDVSLYGGKYTNPNIEYFRTYIKDGEKIEDGIFKKVELDNIKEISGGEFRYSKIKLNKEIIGGTFKNCRFEKCHIKGGNFINMDGDTYGNIETHNIIEGDAVFENYDYDLEDNIWISGDWKIGIINAPVILDKDNDITSWRSYNEIKSHINPKEFLNIYIKYNASMLYNKKYNKRISYEDLPDFEIKNKYDFDEQHNIKENFRTYVKENLGIDI